MATLPDHTCTTDTCWSQHAAGKCLERRGRTYCGEPALHNFIDLTAQGDPFVFMPKGSDPATPHVFNLSLAESPEERRTTFWDGVYNALLAVVVGVVLVVIVKELWFS